MAVLGGKWKLLIVHWLSESPKHFAALRRLLPGISPKVLTEQLRELQGDGVVVRSATGPHPAPVEYSLTSYGQTLVPWVEEARRWGREHLDRLEGTSERV